MKMVYLDIKDRETENGKNSHIVNIQRCNACKKLPTLIIDRFNQGFLECKCGRFKLDKRDYIIYPPVGEA